MNHNPLHCVHHSLQVATSRGKSTHPALTLLYH